MTIDYSKLVKGLVGSKVPKPLSGTLSGHAAGEPFDKMVYAEIKKQYPKNTFRQYEFLNDLYLRNPHAISLKQKHQLFNSPTVLFLLSRGKTTTSTWSEERQFEEKQDDTADILVTDGRFYELIDVKTKNLSKKALPPNIISSYKLAQMCGYMIDNKDYGILNIKYIEIEWLEEDKYLVCKNAHYGDLFKAKPSTLYINWAAAMQIQFFVSGLDQTFDKSMNEWTHQYLKHFVDSVYRRAKYMVQEYAKPFEKYLK